MQVTLKSRVQRNFNSAKHLKSNEEGFTIAEAVVALGVILIVSAGTMTVFSMTIRAAGATKYITAATYVGRHHLEAVKNTEFALITSLYPDGVSNLVVGTSLPAGATWTVTYPDGTGVNPLTITVTVAWTESGQAKSIQLTTQVVSL
jgi:type II secretory pathway pseudopilin PulG